METKELTDIVLNSVKGLSQLSKINLSNIGGDTLKTQEIIMGLKNYYNQPNDKDFYLKRFKKTLVEIYDTNFEEAHSYTLKEHKFLKYNILIAGIIGAGCAIGFGINPSIYFPCEPIPAASFVIGGGTSAYLYGRIRDFFKINKTLNEEKKEFEKEAKLKENLETITLNELDSVLQDNEVKVKSYLYPEKNE